MNLNQLTDLIGIPLFLIAIAVLVRADIVRANRLNLTARKIVRGAAVLVVVAVGVVVYRFVVLV